MIDSFNTESEAQKSFLSNKYLIMTINNFAHKYPYFTELNLLYTNLCDSDFECLCKILVNLDALSSIILSGTPKIYS